MSDGIRIDSYLETGNESYLERIATYGYEGALRKDRDDRPTGMFKAPSDNYPVAEFKSEQLRLTRALRDINRDLGLQSDRIRFSSFDIDALAGGGYEDIEELLAAFSNEPAVKSITALLNRVQGESIEDEIHRLGMVSDTVKQMEPDLKRMMGKAGYSVLHQWILTLRDSLVFNRTANTAISKQADAIFFIDKVSSLRL